MNPRALRLGLFALVGLGLGVLAVVLLGGRWLTASEVAEMRFERSVYGLQVGAPVVLRGVRVGQVTAVGLAPAGPGGLAMPVTAELDRSLLQGLLGATHSAGSPAVPALLQQGLVARLSTQSLLTGLLYVDLDLDPQRARALAGPTAGSRPAGAPPLIPTEATRLQTLQAQLEGLDLARIGQDLGAVAASARQLLADPQAQRALVQASQAALAVQALAQRMEREVGPLSQATRATLAEGRQAAQAWTPVARQVGEAAAQAGTAASQVQTLAAAGVPLVGQLQGTAAELSRTAATLREVTEADSPLRQQTERTLQEVARAARALRELSEMIEQQPDALVRGRAPAP